MTAISHVILSKAKDLSRDFIPSAATESPLAASTRRKPHHGVDGRIKSGHDDFG
jgi:hypothetical protein